MPSHHPRPPPSPSSHQHQQLSRESTPTSSPEIISLTFLSDDPNPHAVDPEPILLSNFPSNSSLHPESFVRGTSSPSPTPVPLPDAPTDVLASSFMDRTRHGNNHPRANESSDAIPVPKMAGSPAASWWGGSPTHVGTRSILSLRPKEMAADEKEARMRTKERVALAVRSVLGTTSDVAHEILSVGADLAEFAPVPGLAAVAKTLLQIWDAVEYVDLNAMTCLRLTERCAETLFAVREEVYSASGDVSEDLRSPVQKLEESFLAIAKILEKEANRPFLKRYLKRDEILHRLADCETDLGNALDMFRLRVQMRILNQLKEAEKNRQADTLTIIDNILHQARPAPTNTLQLEGVDQQDPALQSGPPVALQDPNKLTPEQIRTAVSQYYAAQNAVDMAKDTEKLRELMRKALQTSSDAAMLEVLQIKRQDLPEAIKTLQRALERTIERDSEAESPKGPPTKPPPKPPVSPLRRISILAPSTSFKRALKADSAASTEDSTSNMLVKDTLHREFLESGIDALKRMSQGVEINLPSWTITKFEVDRDHKIGIGFFSDVYKGSWNGRPVAIKVLAETTPREIFKREVAIWKTLRHPNVLELCGASSASGDPPWFFVSPYKKNGSLVQFLKHIQAEAGSPSSFISGRNPALPYATPPPPSRAERTATYPLLPGVNAHPRAPSPLQESSAGYRNSRDLHRFMYEIAKGMQYLHSQNVLHGDLKAANVLVDDRLHCVITDFGQSEMKSEACRLSGKTLPHGTLRWQAPELISGSSSLTQAMDVYAYAITCIEILTWGTLPWGFRDDSTVRYYVLEKDERPPFPTDSRYLTPLLRRLIQISWNRDPSRRPPFNKIVLDMKQVRRAAGDIIESNSPRFFGLPDLVNETSHRPSPDIRPGDLPPESTPEQSDFSNSPQRETSVPTNAIQTPEAVIYTPTTSRESSMLISISSEEYDSQESIPLPHHNGINSPPPEDERAIQSKNERRYRMLLRHDYHPSLVLPLWDPSPVELGSVGYLDKPRGAFVTLFNALHPHETNIEAIREIPPITKYGNLIYGSRNIGKKNLIDVITGWLTSRKTNDAVPKPVSRRYSFDLKAGRRAAFLCVEDAEYQYMMSDEEGHLDVPKHWFKLHIDTIMRTFSSQHPIQREDVFLVVGTLRAPKYALFVSHHHPEGHAHFNVFASSKAGKPWGMFTTDSVYDGVGPSLDPPDEALHQSASNVSYHGNPSNTVLIARLRFRTDKTEPTLMYR